MAKRFSSDRILFAVTLSLVFFGLLMVFSSSAMQATDLYGSPHAFFWRQLAWAALGAGAMLLLMRLDYRHLRHPAVLFPGIFLVYLLLVAVLVADPHQQTHRWLRWGPLSLQPSEFAKLMLVLFLAYFLEKRREGVNDFPRTL